MTRRPIFWLLARIAGNQPRAIARAHRLEAAAGGFAGVAIGMAVALIIMPAVVQALAFAGYGWR